MLFLVLLLLLDAAKSMSLRQRPIINKKSGLYLGQVDQFEGEDTRVQVAYTSSPVKLDSERHAIVDLGLNDWGPIQTSLFMREHPVDYPKRSRESFCSISEEVITFQVRSELDIVHDGFYFDDVIRGNDIFSLTSGYKIWHFAIVPYLPEEYSKLDSHFFLNSISSKLEMVWEVAEVDKKALKLTGKTPQQYLLALHEASNTLFLATDAGIFYVKVKQTQLAFGGNPFGEQPGKLFYGAIKGDFFFVGIAHQGIAVIDLSDPNNVRLICTIGPSHFGKAADETLELLAFDIDDYQLELIKFPNANFSAELLAVNPEETAFFKNSFTLRDRVDSIRSSRYVHNFLFVAEATGIFVFNITGLLSSKALPSDPLPTIIPIEKAKKIVRFHNMLYVLTDNEIGGSAVHEVFLFGDNLAGWENSKVSHSQLFSVNRLYQSSEALSGIYADENYLYTLSPGGNYLYERGIPRGSPLSAAKPFVQGQVHSVHKVLIDGLPFIISLSNKSLVEFLVTVSDPHIRCPPRTDHKSFDVFGKYVFELNATVKNCPLKMNQAAKLGIKQSLETPCVLRTTFEIDYVQSERQNGSLFLKILGFVAVVALGLLVFVIISRRRIAKLNQEHEVLRQEIKHYKEKNSFESTKLARDANKYKLNRSSDSIGSADKKFPSTDKMQTKTDEDPEDNVGHPNKLDVSADA